MTEELILLNIQSASTNQEEKGISKGENQVKDIVIRAMQVKK